MTEADFVPARIADETHGASEQSTEAIRWFRYVRWEDVHAREAEGWVFSADLGPHHGSYSVLMELP